MSTTELEIEKLRENLALAKQHHRNALDLVAETQREVEQAQAALDQALNPEFALTGSD